MASRTLTLRPLQRLTLSLRPGLRALTTPALPPGTTRDPTHENLYYHAFPSSKRIALSFLPRPPVSESSRTVLGTLPAIADAGLNDFKANGAFLKTLSEGMKAGLEARASLGLIYEAKGRPTDGYMTITDERAIPPQGRIGETEDLIGCVLVQDGEILPETYEALPSYRLVTANGVCTLPRGLDAFFVQFLEKIDADERK